MEFLLGVIVGMFGILAIIWSRGGKQELPDTLESDDPPLETPKAEVGPSKPELPTLPGNPLPSPTVLMDGKEILHWFQGKQCCPDCGETEFYHGPCGGHSENRMCVSCHSEFNFAPPFLIDRIGEPQAPTADRLSIYGIEEPGDETSLIPEETD